MKSYNDDISQQGIYQGDEEEPPAPCYEMKLEENDKVIFLINDKEILSCSAKGLSKKKKDYEELKPIIAKAFKYLKNNNIKELKKYMKEIR